MNITSILRKSVFAAVAATVAAVAFTASPAGAISQIGNTAPDAAAQTVTMGAASCTVNGGDPVVVTLNGVRHIRTVGYLSCNRPVHVRASAAALYKGSAQDQTNIQRTALFDRTTVSVIAQRPCRNAINANWAGVGEFEIDLNRDGVVDARVIDASSWNLRSCG